MLTPTQAETRRIYVGQALEVSGEFRKDGEPKDPTLVTLRTKAPSGTQVVTTKESLSNPEVGTWSNTVIADEPGWWSFRLEGAGIVDAVVEHSVEVAPSAFDL